MSLKIAALNKHSSLKKQDEFFFVFFYTEEVTLKENVSFKLLNHTLPFIGLSFKVKPRISNLVYEFTSVIVQQSHSHCKKMDYLY